MTLRPVEAQQAVIRSQEAGRVQARETGSAHVQQAFLAHLRHQADQEREQKPVPPTAEAGETEVRERDADRQPGRRHPGRGSQASGRPSGEPAVYAAGGKERWEPHKGSRLDVRL